MTLEEGLVAYIGTVTGVTNLIGTRFYPTKLPQDPTLPAVTFQRISGARTHSHDGASGLANPRIQINVWADDYADAKAVATQLRLALDGYSGMMGDVNVGSCELIGDHDEYEDTRGDYGVVMEFMFWHAEETG